MAKSRPEDVIDAYRKRQGRKSFFTLSDITKALLFLIMLAALLYVLFTGAPDLPVLIELKTNTPTLSPTITSTPTNTATVTQTETPTRTPTETPDPDNQCDCPSPVIVVVTATFSASDTPTVRPRASITTTLQSTKTATLTKTPLPTDTRTPSPSPTATPTQIVYVVQAGDTLSDIALRFGVTVEAIQTLNNLETTFIYQGQELLIPAP